MNPATQHQLPAMPLLYLAPLRIVQGVRDMARTRLCALRVDYRRLTRELEAITAEIHAARQLIHNAPFWAMTARQLVEIRAHDFAAQGLCGWERRA